jgi:hypothetical protein
MKICWEHWVSNLEVFKHAFVSGGTFGFFLGMSMISLVELFYWSNKMD